MYMSPNLKKSNDSPTERGLNRKHGKPINNEYIIEPKCVKYAMAVDR